MNFWKSEKLSAYLLAASAVLGLVLANSGFAIALDSFQNWDLTWFGSTFTLQGWINNFGLPLFFVLVGLELKREFWIGEKFNFAGLVTPALAAIFGVMVPALAYLLLCSKNADATAGWPTPTATDVSFALAALIILGRGLSTRVRTFLLAFAVIDDIIAVLLIASLFSAPLSPMAVLKIGLALAAFWFIANTRHLTSLPLVRLVLATILAVAAVYTTVVSGFQPTIIGLLIGLLIPRQYSAKVELRLFPVVGFLILPLFALFTTAVPLGYTNVFASVVFWAVAIRPIGKFIGIFLGTRLGELLTKANSAFSGSELSALAALGGIGFTVSLLVAQNAFALDPQMFAAAIVATFIATAVSIGSFAVLAARHRSKTAHSA